MCGQSVAGAASPARHCRKSPNGVPASPAKSPLSGRKGLCRRVLQASSCPAPAVSPDMLTGVVGEVEPLASPLSPTHEAAHEVIMQLQLCLSSVMFSKLTVGCPWEESCIEGCAIFRLVSCTWVKR